MLRWVLKPPPPKKNDCTSSWWLGEKLFPGFCSGLNETIICVMGCETFSKHKNISNKPKATGTRSNAPGMETALLDFIHMSYAMKRFISIYTHTLYTLFQLFRFSEKNYGREKTLLTRTERKIVTQTLGLWAHLQTAFSVFPVLYSILVRVMWFFTLLNVRGISTVSAHIQARIWWSMQAFTKLESTSRASISTDAD